MKVREYKDGINIKNMDSLSIPSLKLPKYLIYLRSYLRSIYTNDFSVQFCIEILQPIGHPELCPECKIGVRGIIRGQDEPIECKNCYKT
jgi:hypothetical protein